MTTTFTCEICMEEKPISKHSLCPNGHLGGCQKCHMSLIKNLYEESFKVFGGKTGAQKCMFCREDLCDQYMGEDWGIKLNKIQAIMMHKYVEKKTDIKTSKNGLLDVLAMVQECTNPQTLSYKIFEDCVAEGRSVNQICKYAKVLTELPKDPSKCQQLCAYWSIFGDDDIENNEDVIEVEIKKIKGKEYFYDPKEKKYYDPETEEEVKF